MEVRKEAPPPPAPPPPASGTFPLMRPRVWNELRLRGTGPVSGDPGPGSSLLTLAGDDALSRDWPFQPAPAPRAFVTPDSRRLVQSPPLPRVLELGSRPGPRAAECGRLGDEPVRCSRADSSCFP